MRKHPRKLSLRKLSLNRETLRTLAGQELREVVGGVTGNPTACAPDSGCRLSCGDICSTR
jgi:hypothetical protein